MPEAGMKRIALKCLTLALLVLCLFVFSKDSTKRLLASAPPTAQMPDVFIENQQNGPLRIISTYIESANPKDFRLNLTATNQSVKAIRAYAIISDHTTESNQSRHVEFANLTKPSAIIQPGQAASIAINDNQEAPIIRIRLAVDFIEFADGTTWGADQQNSRDRLAGQREGAKMEKQRLRALLKSKGRSTVVASLKVLPSINYESVQGANYSREWLEGYGSGVGSIRSRLNKAIQMGGVSQLEHELDKPFDLAEESQ